MIWRRVYTCVSTRPEAEEDKGPTLSKSTGYIRVCSCHSVSYKRFPCFKLTSDGLRDLTAIPANAPASMLSLSEKFDGRPSYLSRYQLRHPMRISIARQCLLVLLHRDRAMGGHSQPRGAGGDRRASQNERLKPQTS